MSATMSAAPTAGTASRPRRVARLAITAGVVGALLGIAQLVTPSMVPPEQFSAPFTPPLATAIAIVLFLHHVALVPLVVVLARVGGAGALGRVGAAIASVGLIGVAVAELVSVTAAGEQGTTPLTDLVESGYSVPTVLVGLGEVLLGVAVVRSARLRGAGRVLPLVAGGYVFLVLIPAVIVGPPVAVLALIVWSLLYAALGVTLLRPVAEY